MTEISPAQRRALRAAAHHLNPVVSISQKGLTPNVLAEIDRSLKAHELIKVRLYAIERDARELIAEEICTALACVNVQHIGKLLVLWRQNPVDATAKQTSPGRSAPAQRRNETTGTKKQMAARLEARRGKRA